MAANTSPEEPNRPVEIVPLPATRWGSGPGSARLGAWRTPTVTTSQHEPVSGPARPDLVSRVHVVSPSTEPVDDPARPVDDARSRLLALLERERTSLLSERDAAPSAVHRAANAAPFPLPGTAMAAAAAAPAADVSADAADPATPGATSTTRLQRTPKPRRADAPARPLPADIAAAIARATGREQPPPPAPRLSLVRRVSARDRLEIVPLDAPPIDAAPLDASPVDASPVDAPPSQADTSPAPEHRRSVIDLRERRRIRMLRRPSYLCPKCQQPGVVDLIDDVTGTVSATCPHCVEMWTTDLHADRQTSTKRKH